MPLEVPMTDVPASGELVVTATGAIEPTELTRAGEYTITAGDFHTCAVLQNGTAKCWGSNSVGQLGDGTTTTRLTPTTVTGL